MLADVIDSFGRAFTVTRYSGVGSYVDGDWSPSGTSSVGIVAIAQPLTGQDMQVESAGQYVTTEKKIITKTQLFTRREGIDADRISIDSDEYEVVKVENWTDTYGNPFYNAYCSKVV